MTTPPLGRPGNVLSEVAALIVTVADRISAPPTTPAAAPTTTPGAGSATAAPTTPSAAPTTSAAGAPAAPAPGPGPLDPSIGSRRTDPGPTAPSIDHTPADPGPTASTADPGRRPSAVPAPLPGPFAIGVRIGEYLRDTLHPSDPTDPRAR